jgi:dynein heavy chain
MRIMDCVLLLKQNRIEPNNLDPDGKPCLKPSWSESLKVRRKKIDWFFKIKNNEISILKLMAGVNFLQSLLEFKRDLINEETVELMEPYIRMEDYDLETAQRVSGSVSGLLSWTVAMTEFFAVNKKVLPLKVRSKI